MGPELAYWAFHYLAIAKRGFQKCLYDGGMSSTYVKRTVNNLRRLITASGKSAREVAHAAGIDESTISKYLSGQRQPQIDVLEKIAKGLGADFQEFFKP